MDGGMSDPQPTHSLNAELFLEIFQHVTDIPTIRAISCVNRTFHVLARDTLLTSLVWKSQCDMQGVMRLIHSNPEFNLARHPTKLVLKLKLPPPEQVDRPHSHYAEVHAARRRELQQQALWAEAFDNARSFSSLQDLVLENMPENIDIFGRIAQLTQIRTLTLRKCSLSHPVNQSTIQELSSNSRISHLILEANGRSHWAALAQDSPYWMVIVPNLPRLRRLTMKLDPDIPQMFSLSDIKLPDLHDLEIFVGANSPPSNVIQQFIAQCKSLRSLRILTRRGADLQMGEVSLLALRSYNGPISLLKSFLPCNAVESLSIPEDGYQKDPEQGDAPVHHPLDEIFDTFRSTPVIHSIRNLTLNLKEYDGAFIQAVLPMVPALRELTVTYRGGGPSEDSMVSFGGEILQELVPHIEVLSIYSTTAHEGDALEYIASQYLWEKPFSELVNPGPSPKVPREQEPDYLPHPPFPLDDVKDFILGWTWRRNLSSLKKVQLSRKSLWWRRDADSPWWNN